MTTPRRTAAKKTAAKKTAPAKVETGADILKRINPQRRVETAEVCLNAALVREFEAADTRLVELIGENLGNSNRLNPGAHVEFAEHADNPSVREQAKVVRKLEEAIVDSLVEFTFTAMTKDEYASICAAHRPRPGDQIDAVVGYNREAVLDAMVRASLTAPVFADCIEIDCDHTECGTWQQLMSVINPSEWGKLRDTANLANSGVNDAPKSGLASRILDRRATASQ